MGFLWVFRGGKKVYIIYYVIRFRCVGGKAVWKTIKTKKKSAGKL